MSANRSLVYLAVFVVVGRAATALALNQKAGSSASPLSALRGVPTAKAPAAATPSLPSVVPAAAEQLKGPQARPAAADERSPRAISQANMAAMSGEPADGSGDGAAQSRIYDKSRGSGASVEAQAKAASAPAAASRKLLPSKDPLNRTATKIATKWLEENIMNDNGALIDVGALKIQGARSEALPSLARGVVLQYVKERDDLRLEGDVAVSPLALDKKSLVQAARVVAVEGFDYDGEHAENLKPTRRDMRKVLKLVGPQSALEAYQASAVVRSAGIEGGQAYRLFEYLFVNPKTNRFALFFVRSAHPREDEAQQAPAKAGAPKAGRFVLNSRGTSPIIDRALRERIAADPRIRIISESDSALVVEAEPDALQPYSDRLYVIADRPQAAAAAKLAAPARPEPGKSQGWPRFLLSSRGISPAISAELRDRIKADPDVNVIEETSGMLVVEAKPGALKRYARQVYVSPAPRAEAPASGRAMLEALGSQANVFNGSAALETYDVSQFDAKREAEKLEERLADEGRQRYRTTIGADNVIALLKRDKEMRSWMTIEDKNDADLVIEGLQQLKDKGLIQDVVARTVMPAEDIYTILFYFHIYARDGHALYLHYALGD